MAFYSDRFLLGESSSYVDDSSYNEDYSDVGSEPLCSTPVTCPTRPHRQPLRPRNTTQFDNPCSSSPHAYSSVSNFYPAPSHMQGDVLTSLLASQNKTLKVLEKFSKRITKLEETVSGMASKSPDASTETSPEQQKRLPPKLSRTVALVHEALDEQDQFRPHLGSKDKHNMKVKGRLAEEISMDKENEYSKFLLERAVQRYFESRKRSWREMTEPGQQDRVLLQAKKRRIRSRKRRLYDRRFKITNEGEERDKFSTLTLEYMSEESTPDEEGVMNVHRPAWRSDSLNEFLEVLDRRANDSILSNKKKHVPQRKQRVVSAQLMDLPNTPKSNQKWAVSKEWLRVHPVGSSQNVTTPPQESQDV